MESSAHVCLPTEVVEEIIEAAWDHTTSAGERQSLLDTFLSADPVLHGLLTRAATRSVILDVSGFSTDDLDLYAALADRAAIEAGIDVDLQSTRSQPEVNEYYNLEVPGGDVLAFRTGLFKCSHLRIEGLTGASDQVHRHRDISPLSRTSPDAHRHTWGYVLTKLTGVIPDARSVTIAPGHSSSWPVAKQTVPALLFPTLRFFPSLRSVRFAVFFEVLNFASQSAAPPPVSQVTSLRLAHVPICECSNRDWRPRRADRHLECCLAATLLEGFPNLQYLRLENPVFLKSLSPPASLHTLTLDAPPIKRIEGRQAFSSLIEYNVSAAVKRGFMSAPLGLGEDAAGGSGRRRKIIVLTGTEEPFGWVSAKAACDEAGIELVRVVEYAEPVVRVDSMLIAIKSSAAGAVPRSPTVFQAAHMMAAAY